MCKSFIKEEMDKILYRIDNDDSINKSFSEKQIENMNDFSELKMHKMLYFIYGLYYKKYGKELFDAKFQAWRYGPVEVNYRYKSNKGIGFEISFNENESEYISSILEKFMLLDTWTLVEMTHETTPWKLAYDTGKRFAEISNNSIKEYFKNLENNE